MREIEKKRENNIYYIKKYIITREREKVRECLSERRKERERNCMNIFYKYTFLY
jgi:hypothetical protein